MKVLLVAAGYAAAIGIAFGATSLYIALTPHVWAALIWVRSAS